MSLSAQEKKFTQKPLVPEGNNAARCYSIIDLGTQKMTYLGETKEVPQVLFTWEFPDFVHTFEAEKGPQPLVIGQKYTVALSNKAKLFKMLSSWRNTTNVGSGKGFLKVYLNQWCLASVIHGTSKKDPSIKYANIGRNGEGISSMPKTMKDLYQNKPAINPPLYFDFDEFSMEAFEKIPEWIQKTIKESPEWKKAEAKMGMGEALGMTSKAAPITTNPISAGDDNGDEPF